MFEPLSRGLNVTAIDAGTGHLHFDSISKLCVPSVHLYLESANKKQFNWFQTYSLSRVKFMQEVGCPYQ